MKTQSESNKFKPTPEQLAIFDFIKSGYGHGIIDAVAGSGKTTTIIQSAELIPRETRVLFCAFNTSIAGEIGRRLNMLGVHNVTVKTMHSLGYGILRANTPNINYQVDKNKYKKLITQLLDSDLLQIFIRLVEIKGFDIHSLTRSDQDFIKNYRKTFTNILNDIVDKHRLTLTNLELKEFKNLLAHYNVFTQVEQKKKEYTKEVDLYFTALKVVLEAGNNQARTKHIIDFADQLFLPDEWDFMTTTLYDYIFIDECQDLSKSQLYIALKHVKSEGRVLAVGDPRQSIYGFAGADIESFNQIGRKLPKVKTLSLSRCFRCPVPVIELAKEFRPDIDGINTNIGHVHSIEYLQVFEKVDVGDLIISRTKAPLMDVVFRLIEQERDIKIHADEVKEFVNELKYMFTRDELKLYRPFDDPAFYDKVCDRQKYFIKKEAYRIEDEKMRKEVVDELVHLLEIKLDFLERQSDIQQNWDNLADLFKLIEKLFEGTEDSIHLSTIHRAKGLENSNVFVINYNKMPLQRPEQLDWELVQEENLQYVAITRAKDNLYLVSSHDAQTDTGPISLFEELNL